MSDKFFNLKFSAVNCNSLNMANSTKIAQMKKIYSLAQINSDIIFLSDIRISQKNKSSGIKLLRKNFLTNPFKSYDFHYNSSMNKRGVGFLIKQDLSLSELNRISDVEENFLALLLQDQEGNKIIIVSIYGPNNKNETFFTNLDRSLTTLGKYPTIIGGDWNCTYSTEPVQNNIDCLNMVEVPNMRHSLLMRTLCDKHELSDPFRYLWPNRQDFTFVPRNDFQTNRSRLDFFLVSRDSLNHIQKCEIDHTTLNKSFDHKTIHLDFRKPRTKRTVTPRISHDILLNPEIELVVKNATIETYATNGNAEEIINVLGPNHNINVTGRIWTLLREAGPPLNLLPPEELTVERTANRTRLVGEITAILDTVDLDILQNVPLECNNAIFMMFYSTIYVTKSQVTNTS